MCHVPINVSSIWHHSIVSEYIDLTMGRTASSFESVRRHAEVSVSNLHFETMCCSSTRTDRKKLHVIRTIWVLNFSVWTSHEPGLSCVAHLHLVYLRLIQGAKQKDKPH